MRFACRFVVLLTLLTATAIHRVGAAPSSPDLYVSSPAQSAIFKLTNDGKAATAVVSGLNQPRGIAFDAAGNLFVAVHGDSNVLKITPDGTRSTYASDIFRPSGLAFDGNGNLFVASGAPGSGNVVKVGPDGTKSVIASVANPYAMVIDAFSNLYVSSLDFPFPVTKITPTGTTSVLTTVFSGATGLAIDQSGTIYVADVGGCRGCGKIYRVAADGTKTVFSEAYRNPQGLVFGSDGLLYSADGLSSEVDVFSSNGQFSLFSSVPNPAFLTFASATSFPLNLSTRVNVQAGDNAAIGGFILRGTASVRILIRGLGPSLAGSVPDPLQDPTLELYDSTGAAIDFNDNWQDTEAAQISGTGIPPEHDREAALIRTLPPGAYTVVERGVSDSTGNALFELYDLDADSDAQLVNLSTRGRVGSADNVMIGGFVIGGAPSRTTILVRALGPSLTTKGVSDALADPAMVVRDANGSAVEANDNWGDTQRTQIETLGLTPESERESAALLSVGPGNYTAVVEGVGSATGVGLVELYNLQ